MASESDPVLSRTADALGQAPSQEKRLSETFARSFWGNIYDRAPNLNVIDEGFKIFVIVFIGPFFFFGTEFSTHFIPLTFTEKRHATSAPVRQNRYTLKE